MKILSAIFMALLVGCSGQASGIPTSSAIPFASAKASSATVQTYQRRLYIRNDSKYAIANMEWYVPECWSLPKWYQNGNELAPGYGPTIMPGKEAEVITAYTPCPSILGSSQYLLFTVNRAAVDTAAFVLTGSPSGHHTRLWIKTWDATHTHSFCRDNGRCHFIDTLVLPPHNADTPGGPVSKATRRCQEYTPIQFFPPAVRCL